MSKSSKNDNDDDWETDPDYVNDVSEQEQRWGGKGNRDAGITTINIRFKGKI